MNLTDIAWLRLAMTPGLGARGYSVLLDVLQDAGMDLAAFSSESRAVQRGLWERASDELVAGNRALRSPMPEFNSIPTAGEVEAIGAALVEHHCRWIGFEHPQFPRRLLGPFSPLPPPVLFWLGDLSLLDRSPTAGIVGTTSPSRGGTNAARALGHTLGEAGWCVVSGLAKGIDQAGQRGALDAGGATVAFLPQGILKFEMPSLLREFEGCENFLIFSTWPPNAGFSGSWAVRRDALIAEASDGLIAVEMSGRGGGTKHTVGFARERQRPVWTLRHARVPREALGNEWLMRTGASAIAMDDQFNLSEESLGALMKQLKEELTRGRARRRVMQLEMFQ